MAFEWRGKDSAPMDGENFIGWSPSDGFLYTLHWDSEDERWATEYEPWSGVFTHWIRLERPND